MSKITTTQIARAATREAQAKEKYAEAKARLDDLIWNAQEQGMSITMIAEAIPQMTRQAVHNVLSRMSRTQGGTKNDRAREWLRSQGHQISDRGPIMPSLMQDYENHIIAKESGK